MGSKKEIAMIVSALTFIPSTTLADAAEIQICAPDKELNKCEKALKDAAITWEGRAEEARVSYHGCLDKLQTRTATVMTTLVVRPQNQVTHEFPMTTFISSAAATFVLGVLMGVLIAR